MLSSATPKLCFRRGVLVTNCEAALMPTHKPAMRDLSTSTPPAQPKFREYLSRAELLELVPLSMSTIDNLERTGVFPSRFKIEPTTRVAWKRAEVEKFMAQRA